MEQRSVPLGKPRPDLPREVSWWMLSVAGGLLFILVALPMAVIWKNVLDVEEKKCQEYEHIANYLDANTRTFLLSNQFDYAFENLKRMQASNPAIVSLEVFLGDRRAFQSGAVKTIRDVRYYTATRSLVMENSKPIKMLVVFSLEEFLRSKHYIQTAFGLIVILLLGLLGVGYWLYTTHRKLVKAEKTKENMIYSITHDAKQDLFVIQMKLSSLLTKLLRKEKVANLERDLKISQESADSLDRYLNNLKDQQGMAKGKIEVMPEKIELSGIVISVMDAFAEKMHVRNMAIELAGLVKGQMVLADPQVVKRVLMNILHNAMKYSPMGGVIKIKQQSEQGFVLTLISDQGQGIPEADWERVFEPYVQLDHKKEGMGLGLATSRQLAMIMGGTLRVTQSELGKGTTFCLALPVYANNKPLEGVQD